MTLLLNNFLNACDVHSLIAAVRCPRYGGYVCDIIIKPGSYAEMPTEWRKKILFGLDSPYIQT